MWLKTGDIFRKRPNDGNKLAYAPMSTSSLVNAEGLSSIDVVLESGSGVMYDEAVWDSVTKRAEECGEPVCILAGIYSDVEDDRYVTLELGTRSEMLKLLGELEKQIGMTTNGIIYIRNLWASSHDTIVHVD